MKMAIIKVFDFFIFCFLCFYFGLFITNYSFISNIVGPTFGLVFLLILRYLVDKKTFFRKFPLSIIGRISKSDDLRILSFCVFFLFLIFSALSIARHFSLSSGSADLGIFDQAIWSASQGDVLFTSLLGNMNLLGYHFYPIIYVFVPFYKVWPSPVLLLVFQALLLATAIIPLYLIARDKLKNRLLIYAFIISYMLSNAVRGVAFSDFHTECFIIPLLFWIYYFLIKRKNILFLFSIFVLLFCKEDVVFLISALGIFAFFFQKRQKMGAFLFLFGISLWFIETKIIIPYCFNPYHKYMYMDRLPFGLTYSDNINTLLTDPLSVTKFFFTGEKIEYCIKLFGPLGFLSFLSPSHYILIAVPLLKNLLPPANFSGFYNITSHYTAAILPFIYISAICGSAWLADKIRYRKKFLILSCFIIFSSLMFYGKTDGHKLTRFLNTIRAEGCLQKISYLKNIPAGASVAANFNLVPHLSHRKYIFEWNPQSKASYITEYVVVDMDLLEYIPKEVIAEIDSYFEDIIERGYKKIFVSPDGRFLIFHNPDIDKTLVEKVNLLSEGGPQE